MNAPVFELPASLEECRRVFGNVPYLSVLGDEDLAALAPITHGREYIAGSTIFYEDDQADAVYFIAAGSVEVFKSDHNGKKLSLAVMRDSGVLGEMGLLNNTPRAATARTLTPVRVLCLRSDEFNEGLKNGSIAAFRMVLGFGRVLAQRLSDMDQKLFEIFQSDPQNPKFEQGSDFKQQLLTLLPDSHW